MADFSQCQLTRFPQPVLSSPAVPVDKIDDSIRQLAGRMIDIMVENKGVGLAGPQAGVNLRIFVVSIDGTREDAKVYINPEIETSGPVVENEEGCLSLPGVCGLIRRFSRCRITAFGLDGKRFTEEGSGLLARAFQHEYDHIEGRMIKDRLGVAGELRARRRLNQLRQEYRDRED